MIAGKHLLLALATFVLGESHAAPRNAATPQQTRSVHGRVVKGGTLDALPSVKAVINQTTLGSVSSERGQFEIRDVPVGASELLLQHPCYLPVRVILPRDGDVYVSIGLPYDISSEKRAGCGGLK